MGKKYSYEENISWIVNGIDEKSKSALDFFYSSYSPSSRAGVCSMVRGVCSEIKKNSFAQFTYNDYLLVTENENGKTKKMLKESFFKFLYIFDIIEDQSGFEHCFWDKDKLIKKFDKIVENRTSRNKQQNKNKPTLSISDLEKLIVFCDSAQSFSDLRLAFCFYALFFLSMKVEELRDLTKDQYENGIIITEESEYFVNDKFSEFLEETFKKGIGFGMLNEYVAKLGNILNIDHLIPREIKRANDIYSNVCPICGQKALSFSDRWGIINNVIVCTECIEMLVEEDEIKKNKIDNQLASYSIELTPKDQIQEIEQMVSSFDDIKKSVNTPKNYEEINHFLKLIGNLGEKYVLEYEQKQLAALGSAYSEQVDGSYALDGSNGFDILSYTEKGEKKYIEVKTTTGDVSEPFYISANEIETAEKLKSSGQIYKLYRVGKILSDEVTLIIYDDLDCFETENVVYKKVLHKE